MNVMRRVCIVIDLAYWNICSPHIQAHHPPRSYMHASTTDMHLIQAPGSAMILTYLDSSTSGVFEWIVAMPSQVVVAGRG